MVGFDRMGSLGATGFNRSIFGACVKVCGCQGYARFVDGVLVDDMVKVTAGI